LLAPLVLISGIGAVLVAFAPGGGWLVLPLGMHVGCAIGDLWLAAVTVFQPSDTRVEDRKTGVAFWD